MKLALLVTAEFAAKKKKRITAYLIQRKGHRFITTPANEWDGTCSPRFRYLTLDYPVPFYTVKSS